MTCLILFQRTINAVIITCIIFGLCHAAFIFSIKNPDQHGFEKAQMYHTGHHGTRSRESSSRLALRRFDTVVDKNPHLIGNSNRMKVVF